MNSLVDHRFFSHYDENPNPNPDPCFFNFIFVRARGKHLNKATNENLTLQRKT